MTENFTLYKGRVKDILADMELLKALSNNLEG